MAHLIPGARLLALPDATRDLHPALLPLPAAIFDLSVAERRLVHSG